MKKTWMVVGVATAVVLGAALLAASSGRQAPERRNTNGDPLSISHRPVAVSEREQLASPEVAGKQAGMRTETAAAVSAKLGAMPPVQKSSPVRAEPASPLKRQLSSALAGVEAETDPMRREKLIESAMDELAGADFGNVLAYLQATASNISLDMAARLVRRWADEDPAAAAEWAGSLPEGAARQAALNQAAIVWANRDLAGAADWALRLPAGEEHNRVVRQVAYEAARTAPVDALNLAVGLPADPDRDELVRYAAREWTPKDPAAAGWVSGFPETAMKETAMDNLTSIWANQDAASLDAWLRSADDTH